MQTRHFGLTDVGLRRRHNEDAFLADADLGVFIVCDGVGGRAKGEVASRETADLIWEWLKREESLIRALQHQPTEVEIRHAILTMRQAIQNACYLVHGMGEIDPERRGMSTTTSALLVGHGVGIVGQVGDSRVYRHRGGQVEQITEDHTLVNYQLKHGLITPAEAESSKSKHVITRAVGHKDYVEVDVSTVPVEVGDKFLLCSDGLHGYVSEPEDLAYLLSLDVQAAAEEAIRFANAHGGKDNITALVVEVTEAV
ncbi:MAG: serine/threonine-protein phosphatase [Deltaproteobacteria bacterium]|nr:MAG: serine/threonine-protein phosphatase [Deltaproteobacteria bacterium]